MADVLRALPPLAYFFLLIIWLVIDEARKVTLLALAALPPAAVATTAAIVAAPVGLTEAAPALGATRLQMIRDVVARSALPETVTGAVFLEMVGRDTLGRFDTRRSADRCPPSVPRRA